MGLRFVEKGDYVIKAKDYEVLRKYCFSAKCAANDTSALLANANGANKESPFREGLFAEAERKASKSKTFIDVLCETLERAVT